MGRAGVTLPTRSTYPKNCTPRTKGNAEALKEKHPELANCLDAAVGQLPEVISRR